MQLEHDYPKEGHPGILVKRCWAPGHLKGLPSSAGNFELMMGDTIHFTLKMAWLCVIVNQQLSHM